VSAGTSKSRFAQVAGFTVIEVLIALGMAGGLLVLVMELLNQHFRLSISFENRWKAQVVAESIADIYASMDSTGLSSTLASDSSVDFSPFGSDYSAKVIVRLYDAGTQNVFNDRSTSPTTPSEWTAPTADEIKIKDREFIVQVTYKPNPDVPSQTQTLTWTKRISPD
jgi:hypothetical protein